MDNNIFGKNIRKLRAMKGLSRKEFAQAINTPYSTVTSWENGDKVPKIERLPTIARLFNVSESRLLHHQMSDNEILEKDSSETDPIERMAQILIEKYRNVPEEHKPRIEKEILRMAQLLEIEIEMQSQHEE
ncbi:MULTISPECIES: helix-turn-helix domain-containing protein [Bacillus]|uniref:helix-turn-helix domain-containing protein n=1 Tax=Bacillus TaxID=1386 RepID=UPI000994FB16|nr:MULTISPECIES: helix-turn-helix transcriptional regulator [Bacillus]MCC3688453.1 helix-turn-helix domain-containing protein [Bacillus cereus]MCD2338664.1 helix-turn-helix domain-containing protein [Bacillus cereus]MDA2213817.1 helix-turn-helix transcriptional regulator [Bacillus cereus]MDA2225248.1 helix-turn-helix transcriptional regulator [Bacillus cereus]MDZ4422631.1 helix-turn-helix transcriptional regulator [Bacillus cereus]